MLSIPLYPEKKSQCYCHVCFSHDNKLQVIFAQRFECLLALFPFLLWLSALAIKSMSEVLWLSQPPAGTLWKSLFWGYCCSLWYEDFIKVLMSYGHFCSGLPWSNLMYYFRFLTWWLRGLSLGTLYDLPLQSLVYSLKVLGTIVRNTEAQALLQTHWSALEVKDTPKWATRTIKFEKDVKRRELSCLAVGLRRHPDHFWVQNTFLGLDSVDPALNGSRWMLCFSRTVLMRKG